VNVVRPDSISIDRLTAMSGRLDTRAARRDGTTRVVGTRRGIRFGCGEDSEAPSSTDVVVSVIIRERQEFSNSYDGVRFSETSETVLVRKKCSHQELADWKEKHILAIVGWVILELDDDIRSLVPGTEYVTLAEAEIQRRCRFQIQWAEKETRNIPVEVSIDGRVVGGFGKLYGAWFDAEGGVHNVTVRSGDLSSSAAIHMIAGQTMQYEIFQKPWTWSGSIGFRHVWSAPRRI
jgi:hypothetical protein